MQDQVVPSEVAAQWLPQYAKAISAGDAAAVADLILPVGWFRDVLTFTWDLRSLEGTEKITAYLSEHLKPGDVSELRLVDDIHCIPSLSPKTAWSDIVCVEAAFTYETKIAHGRGYVRLVRAGDEGPWKAASVCMMVFDLKGHEESGFEHGMYGDHTLAWSDVLQERRAKIEADPQVVIIGGGQTGLHLAARFKQMNISTLIVEKNERIGDNWRQRYPTLSLHTPRNFVSMLYQPYPDNWPLFPPRDKIADWLEFYAVTQDLVVWTKSQVEGQPAYHDGEGHWDITINRNGNRVTLHPSHIVMATSNAGQPMLITLPHQEEFKGTVLHAANYQGGRDFTDKRVIVVGAGNTGIDICQDLCFHKAKSVTMIQRSSSCVVTGSKAVAPLAHLYPDGVPIHYGDFKFASQPMGQFRQIMMARTQLLWDSEKELHEKLRKGGVALNMGPNGAGQPFTALEMSGGFWLDQGGADLIASGDIKVKQGSALAAYTSTGLKFSDGSELEADTVIFATGYRNINDAASQIFGEEDTNRACKAWGLDEEGELRGAYRPTGHPGLWFGTGGFFNSRFMSKHLAILIKATEVGLIQRMDAADTQN